MTRLVNAIRSDIVDNLIHHTFADRCRAQCKEQAKLAMMVYNDHYSKTERDCMEALPANWLPVNEYIRCRADEFDFMLSFDGSFQGGAIRYVLSDDEKPAQVFMRFPNMDNGSYLKIYDKSNMIGGRLIRFTETNRKIITDIKSAQQQARTTLATFTTVEKLIEAWPEIEPMTRNITAVPPPSLPAIPTSDLNELFGLPIKGAA